MRCRVRIASGWVFPFESATVLRRDGKPRRVRQDGGIDMRGRYWAGKLPPNARTLNDKRWAGERGRRPGELTLTDIQRFLAKNPHGRPNWRALSVRNLEAAGIVGRDGGVVFGCRKRRFYSLEQAKEIMRLFHTRRRPGRASRRIN